MIYHYTSMANLLSILRNRELWASDFRYSNDATETKYGRDALVEKIRALAQEYRSQPPTSPDDRPDSHNNPAYFANIFEEIATEQAELKRDSTPFGVAFSKSGDRLSQWRGYAASNGCSIGIDKRKLIPEPPDFQMDYEFLEVGYGYAGIDAAYASIRSVVAPVGRTSSSFDPERNHDIRSKSFASRAFLAVKDPSFEEEQEVRLLLSTPPYRGAEGHDSSTDRGELCFRTSPTGLAVPYWKVPIDPAGIREIYVGPGVHKERNIAALHDYFERRDSKWFDSSVSPDIRPSAIPFQ